jgi:tetratricopeptide (TPR) repeat protein
MTHARRPFLLTPLGALVAVACVGIVAMAVWMAINRNVPEKAAPDSGRAVPLDPNNADAVFQRGCEYLKARQYDKAVADFERLVQQIDPDNRLGYASRKEYAEAYLGQGTAIRGEGRQLLKGAMNARRGSEGTLAKAKMQQAVDLFTKAVRHDPTNALLYSRRGTCLLQLGQLDAAVDDLTKAIGFGTQEQDLDLIYRGFAYVKTATRQGADPAARNELLEKSKADYLAAREKNPRNADAEYLLAECHVQLGDYQAAIGPYQSAIEKHPQWPDPWFSLRDAYFYQGNCFLLTGDLAKAAEDFSRALDLTGDFIATPAETAKAMHALAAEFAKRKQLREANECNEKAIGLAPDQAAKEEYRAAGKPWKADKP